MNDVFDLNSLVLSFLSLSLSSIIHTCIGRAREFLQISMHFVRFVCFLSSFWYAFKHRKTSLYLSLARACSHFFSYHPSKPIIWIFTELQCRWNQLILSLDELLALPMEQTKHNLSLFYFVRTLGLLSLCIVLLLAKTIFSLFFQPMFVRTIARTICARIFFLLFTNGGWSMFSLCLSSPNIYIYFCLLLPYTLSSEHERIIKTIIQSLSWNEWESLICQNANRIYWWRRN